MSVKKLSKELFLNWVDDVISTEKKVYGVQAHKDKADKFEYALLDNAASLRLDYDVTVLSPSIQPTVIFYLDCCGDNSTDWLLKL